MWYWPKLETHFQRYTTGSEIAGSQCMWIIHFWTKLFFKVSISISLNYQYTKTTNFLFTLTKYLILPNFSIFANFMGKNGFCVCVLSNIIWFIVKVNMFSNIYHSNISFQMYVLCPFFYYTAFLPYYFLNWSKFFTYSGYNPMSNIHYKYLLLVCGLFFSFC